MEHVSFSSFGIDTKSIIWALICLYNKYNMAIVALVNILSLMEILASLFYVGPILF